MNDEQLAAKLAADGKSLASLDPDFLNFNRPDAGVLMGLASERLYALSAKCALLGASLAQAELEADAARNAEPFGYFRATPFGWEDCAADAEGAIALYERPAPVVSAEPVAWANFAENGNIRIWTSAAGNAVRIAKENGIRLTPLYAAPQPDRALLRRVVDAAWNAATESETVPATEWADRIIDSVVPVGCAPQSDRAPAPVGLRPYEPTEAMRWAAKQIDPALTHEQIRALWSAMWSAAPKRGANPVAWPDRVAELEAEVDELQALCDRQYELLNGVALAVLGKEPPLTKWSHHDLPDRVHAAMAALALALESDKQHKAEVARLKYLLGYARKWVRYGADMQNDDPEGDARIRRAEDLIQEIDAALTNKEEQS